VSARGRGAVPCPARRVLRPLSNLPPPRRLPQFIASESSATRICMTLFLFCLIWKFIVFASQFVARAAGCGTALHSVDSSASGF